MTQYEFIEQYRLRNNMTVEAFIAANQIALPCHCEADDCDGWAMFSSDNPLAIRLHLYQEAPEY